MNSSIAKTITALIISTGFLQVSAKVAPNYINICPGLTSKCLKDNIQKTIPHFVKGVPGLGLNATDPFRLDYLKYDLPGGLKIEFYNGTLTGLRNCIVDSAKYDNYVADLDIHCDIIIKGKYRAEGRVILFYINGEGDAKMKAKNVIIQSKITFQDKIRDGVEYQEAKSIKTDYRFGDRVSFDFTNLFKGNPELSKTILEFLNENWKDIVDEFAKPIINPILQAELEIIKKFFKVIPKNELIA